MDPMTRPGSCYHVIAGIACVGAAVAVVASTVLPVPAIITVTDTHGNSATASTSLDVGSASATSFPTPIQHVFLIMMENAGVDQVYGTSSAPYETQLANTYAWGGDALTNASGIGYYAVCHPSAPNYLSITGGQPLQCGSDSYNTYSVDNLGNQLATAGIPWVAYGESMTVPCQPYDSGEYVVRHMVFPYYADLGGSEPGSVCYNDVQPLASLLDDYPFASTPPAFTYIAPNLIDDGHDSSVSTGDAWLDSFVSKLMAEPWFSSSVILITYDESYGANRDGGYSGLAGGPVYFVAVSPFTKEVGAYPADTSHYDALATIEWLLDLPYLSSAGSATFPPMKGLFNFNTTSATYTVTFSESGLPAGTSWSVTLKGATQSSSGNLITFSEANGTYAYSVGPVSGYTVTQSVGSLTVRGAPLSQAVAFSAPGGGGSSSGFLGLSGNTGYYLLGGIVAVVLVGVAVAVIVRTRRP